MPNRRKELHGEARNSAERTYDFLADNELYDGTYADFSKSLNTRDGRDKIWRFLHDNGLYDDDYNTFSKSINDTRAQRKIAQAKANGPAQQTKSGAEKVTDENWRQIGANAGYDMSGTTINAPKSFNEQFKEDSGISAPKKDINIGYSEKNPNEAEMQKATEDALNGKDVTLKSEQEGYVPTDEENEYATAASAVGTPEGELDNSDWRQERLANTTYNTINAEKNADEANMAALSQYEENLDEMYDDIDARLSASNKNDQDDYYARNKAPMIGMGSVPMIMPSYGTSLLASAKAQLDEARYLRENAKRYEAEPDGWKRFASDFGHSFIHSATDLSTYDFGMTDLANVAVVKRVLEKVDAEGEDALSVDEKSLLDAVVLNTAAKAWYGNKQGIGTTVGATTMEMLPFMVELMANPVAGIGKGSSKAFARGLTKHAVSMIKKISLATAKKLATKEGLKLAGTKTLKGALALSKQVATDIAKGYAMAATSGIARTSANVLERETGEVQLDNDGNYAGRKGQIGTGEAIYKGLTAQSFEYSSEFAGDNYISPMLKALGIGITSKIASRELTGNLGKLIKGVGDVYNRIGKTGFAQMMNRFYKLGHYNGPVGEYLEEFLNNVENATFVKDMNFGTGENGVFNFEQNWATFLGVAIPSLFTGGISSNMYAAKKTFFRAKIDHYDSKGDKAFASGMESAWGDVKKRLDVIPLDNIYGTYRDVIAVADEIGADDRQKYAMLNYMKWKFADKAYDTALDARIAEEENDIQSTIDMGEELGKTINTPEDMHQAGVNMQKADEEISGMLDPNVKLALERMLNDGASATELNGILSNLDDEQRKVADRYIIARSVIGGIQKKIGDTVNKAVEGERKTIEPFVDENGKYQYAMYEGKPVFVMGQEGDNLSIVISVAEGTTITRMVNVNDLDKDEEGDVLWFEDNFEEHLNTFATELRQQLMDSAQSAIENNSNTVTEIGQGTKFTIADGENSAQFIVIGQNEQDGTFEVAPLEPEYNAETGAVDYMPNLGKTMKGSAQDFINLQNEYWDGKEGVEMVAEEEGQSEVVENEGEEETAEATEEAPMSEETAETTEEAPVAEEKQSNITYDEKNNPIFDNASDDEVAEYFGTLDTDVANTFIGSYIDAANKALDEVNKDKPKVGNEPKASDYLGRIGEYLKAKGEYDAQQKVANEEYLKKQEEAQKMVDRWVSIRGKWQKNTADMAREAQALETFNNEKASLADKENALGDAQSLEEYVMREAYKYRYQWSDTARGAGLSSEVFGKDDAGERGNRLAYLSNKDGLTPRKVSELIAQSAKESGLFGQDINDDDVFQILQRTLLDFENRGKVLDAVAEIRRRQIEKPEDAEEATPVEMVDDGSALAEEVEGGRIADSEVTAEMMDEESVAEEGPRGRAENGGAEDTKHDKLRRVSEAQFRHWAARAPHLLETGPQYTTLMDETLPEEEELELWNKVVDEVKNFDMSVAKFKVGDAVEFNGKTNYVLQVNNDGKQIVYILTDTKGGNTYNHQVSEKNLLKQNEGKEMPKSAENEKVKEGTKFDVDGRHFNVDAVHGGGVTLREVDADGNVMSFGKHYSFENLDKMMNGEMVGAFAEEVGFGDKTKEDNTVSPKSADTPKVKEGETPKKKETVKEVSKGVERKLAGLSDEENEELVALKKQMKELMKGGGKLYSSIVPVDPNAPQKIAVGTRIAFLYVKSGIRQFRDFCDSIIGDLGDEIRPYLKSIYNAVRDYPGSEDFADDMTPYDEVRKFDVLEYDKETAEKMDVLDKADEMVAEEKQLKEQDSVAEVVVRQGKPRKKDNKGNDGFFGDLFGGSEQKKESKKSGEKKSGEKKRKPVPEGKVMGKFGKYVDKSIIFEAEKKEPITLDEARRLYANKKSIDPYHDMENVDANSYKELYDNVAIYVDKLFEDWNIGQYADEEYSNGFSGYNPKSKYHKLSDMLLESSAWGRGHAAALCLDALSGDLSRARGWIINMVANKFRSYYKRDYIIDDIVNIPQRIADVESVREFLYKVLPNMKELIDNVIALDIDCYEQRAKHCLDALVEVGDDLKQQAEEYGIGVAPVHKRNYNQTKEEAIQAFNEWIVSTTTTDKVNIDGDSNNGWHCYLTINDEYRPLYVSAKCVKDENGEAYIVAEMPKWVFYSRRGDEMFFADEIHDRIKSFIRMNPDVDIKVSDEYIEFANASDVALFFEEVFPNKVIPTDLENYDVKKDGVNADILRAMIANGVNEVHVGKHDRFKNPVYDRFFDKWSFSHDYHNGGGSVLLSRVEGESVNSLSFDMEEQTKPRVFEFPKGVKDVDGKEIGTKKASPAVKVDGKKEKVSESPKEESKVSTAKETVKDRGQNEIKVEDIVVGAEFASGTHAIVIEKVDGATVEYAHSNSADGHILYNNHGQRMLKGALRKYLNIHEYYRVEKAENMFGLDTSGNAEETADVSADAQKTEAEGGKFKVGDYAMYKNYMLEVESVNSDGTINLKGGVMHMGINLMQLNPSDVRVPGSDESIDFYYNEYVKYIADMKDWNKKLSQQALDNVEKQIDDMTEKSKNNNMTLTELEQMARLLGMRKALVEDIDGVKQKSAKKEQQNTEAEEPKKGHFDHERGVIVNLPEGVVSQGVTKSSFYKDNFHKQAFLRVDGKGEAIKMEMYTDVERDKNFIPILKNGRYVVVDKYCNESYDVNLKNEEQAKKAQELGYEVEGAWNGFAPKWVTVKTLEDALELYRGLNGKKEDAKETDKQNGSKFKVGEKVMYKGEEATIHSIEKNGDLTLDTGMAPVIYEVAEPSEVQKIDGVKEKTAEEEQPKKATRENNKYHGGDMVRAKDGILYEIQGVVPEEGGWSYDVLNIKGMKSNIKEEDVDEVVDSYADRKAQYGLPVEEAPKSAETSNAEEVQNVEEAPEAEEKPKTKEQWLAKIYEVRKQFCELYGVPYEPLFDGAYRFEPRITKGYRLEQFEPYYDAYKKKLDEAVVEPASEKQIAFIKKLAEEGEWKMIEGISLNKINASYIITILKASEDAVTNKYSTASDFEEFDNELRKVIEMSGGNVVEHTDSGAEIGENSVSLQSEERGKFSDSVAERLLDALDNGEKAFKSIVDVRKMASDFGMNIDMDGRDDILLQELIEDGLVKASRSLVKSGRFGGRKSRELYDAIVRLYELQPTISMRDSNRIKMQQYSTPLPMGFVADMFAESAFAKDVLEPTAGNGMLVSFVPASKVHANELDKTRLENLQRQGFKKVTNEDANKEGLFGNSQYDAVISNPPFGYADARSYDGKMISGLDPQITLNALASMKDNGRASIIIGGNLEYASNGSIKGKKAFFSYLYDHYNVKGIVNIDGSMYSRQGTTYPTMMIFIDGRRTAEQRAQTTCYPPIKDSARGTVDNFDDLYDVVTEIINDNRKTDGTEIIRSQEGQLVFDYESEGRQGNGSTRNSEHSQDDGNGGRGGNMGDSAKESGTGVRGERGETSSNGTSSRGTNANRQGNSRGNSGNNAVDGVRKNGNAKSGNGLEEKKTADKVVKKFDTPKSGIKQKSTSVTAQSNSAENEGQRQLGQEKLAYRRHSGAFSLQSVAPANMVEAMDKTLSRIEKENGSIDEFVRKELGYDTIEDAHNALAAEQMDSVAMAINQMKNGQALIIGDQTGVGKGRQMAALVRWACKQGKKPVFITQKADLFTDIYRDLVDVGSGDLKPFIFNSDGAMVDADGKPIHKPYSKAEQDKVFASGKLPEECDFAVLTYSQVNTGDAISAKEAEENSKSQDNDGNGRSSGPKKSKRLADGKPTPKATFLRAIAKDNYMFLDESHTAAGSSNTGNYLQSIVKTTKACTFASATFAKRPDTMPLYALRTAMSKANLEPHELIKVIEKGGVTLQEIMSRELTDAGQMVRRERDMSDVITDWTTIDDPVVVKKARENYDKTIEVFNDIIAFQKLYVDPNIEAMNKALAITMSTGTKKKGTDKMGVSNVPFASKTYNYTKQLMLALKVDAIVDAVENEIKEGRHPVIALESTMEANLKDYSPNDIIDEPTFAASMLRGLKTTLAYTVKDAEGKEQHSYYLPSDLGPEGERAYYALQEKIRENTSDIFISPLDAIIEGLHERGYSVGELTGRNLYTERNEDGKVVVKKRVDKDKKKMQRQFNSGELDVLILNKSASTGISLHASEKFSDQRQRSMIIAQPLSDINDYMQMIGRIDRTGQVHRGYYINLGLPVPAENRFLMMLSTKLKSLNANTTSAQDSESNDVDAPDLLNKYGSRCIVEFFRDHVELYERLGNPLKLDIEKGGYQELLEKYTPNEEDARKLTGYVALLKTEEQDFFYDDVVQRYENLIKYLNETGENDLKITTMPLRAKTIAKRVSSKGKEPNGENPFAKDAFVEKVEMDVLRKPMKANEVNAIVSQLNAKGETEQIESFHDNINADRDEKLAKEEERYNKEKSRMDENLAKIEARIKTNKKITPQQMADEIARQRSEYEERIEKKHNDNVAKAEDNARVFNNRIDMFRVGDSYLVPDDLDVDVFSGASPAIFCGYKAKDHMTPSTTFAVFAILDGRRKIELPLSQMDPLMRITRMTRENWDAAHRTTLLNWDSQIPSDARKEGYIMTGNILQAVADTQNKETGAYEGQLISYTDIDGNIHDGILMPDKWTPGNMKGSGTPINQKKKELMDYQTLASVDGKVKLNRGWGNNFSIVVPKSKKEGGKYFENNAILSLVDGGRFYQRQGAFRADFNGDNLDKMLNILSNLGVRVVDEESDDNVRFRSNSVFVSNAESAVRDIKQDKASGEQWLNMLKKNGGLKAEEDKWIGLSDFLSGKKSVTKEEVLKYIAENKVEVQDVEYGGGNSIMKGYSHDDNGARKAVRNALIDKRGLSFADDFMDVIDVYYEEVGNSVSFGYNSDEDAEELYNKYHDESSVDLTSEDTDYEQNYFKFYDWAEHVINSVSNKSINSTRVRYTTNGLDDYREIALVVPSVEPYNSNDNIHFGDAGGGRAVAWVRFGDYTAEDGSKVLVIDEIQSKRHQDGREQGYDSDYKNSPKYKYNHARLEMSNYRADMERKYGRFFMEDDMTPEERAEYDRLLKALEDASNYDSAKVPLYNVPDAPFRKNWHELAMKRMLRYASENGYDKIAWTDGRTQAERYSLGGKVKSLSSLGTFSKYNSTKQVYIEVNHTNMELDVNKEGIVVGSEDMPEAVGKKLEEVVGKEYASKLLQDGSQTIIPSEMNIGGEGMRGFYDEMLPMYMNKYGKKWGVKVESELLEGLQDGASGYDTEIGGKIGLQMWTVPVTEEMKASVMSGQAMFTRYGGTKNNHTEAELGEMEQAVGDVAEVLNTPVKVVRSEEEVDNLGGLSTSNKEILKKDGKGVFNTRTGEIVVYLPNNADKEDAVKSVLHEAVGHKGLRAMVGEKAYNNFLWKVYKGLDEKVRKHLNTLAVTKYGYDIYEAVDEYLAEKAESDITPTWWMKVVSALKEALRMVGINVGLSKNDVRYLLWQSKNRLMRGDIVSEAESRVMRMKLGIGRASANALETVAADNKEEGDVRFSLRTKDAPKVTKKGYAVFVVRKDKKTGKVILSPKMLKETKVGVPAFTWLDSDTGMLKRDADGKPIENNRGRAVVSVNGSQSGGKDSNKLSWRPGKHLSVYTNAAQFASTKDGMLDDDVVFFEVEYAADPMKHLEYQYAAWEYGMQKNGKYINDWGGIPFIPEDSYYIYRTNGIADGATPMIITGAYRITRALTDAEAKEMNEKAGGKWVPRRGGELTQERLAEIGIDEEGLRKMSEEFDTSEIAPHHDESDEARALSGYVRRQLNFDDANLIHAIEENYAVMGEDGISLEEYKEMYGGGNNPDGGGKPNVATTSKKGGVFGRIKDGRPTDMETVHFIDRVKEFKKKYNTVPMHMIGEDVTVADLVKVGINKYDAEIAVEECKKGRLVAAYLSTSERIVIFDAHTDISDKEIEATLFHENVHAMIDMKITSAEKEALLERFMKVGQEIELNMELLDDIRYAYAEKDWANEYFTYSMEQALMNGTLSDVLDCLTEEQAIRIEQLVKEFGYERRKEFLQRSSETEKIWEVRLSDRERYEGPRQIKGRRVVTTFTDGTNIVEKEQVGARAMYERSLREGSYKFTEAWQDSMLGLKKLMESVVKAEGGKYEDIADWENAYMAENLMSSVNQAEFEAYRTLLYEPMLETVDRIMKKGVDYDEVKQYIVSKHGIERNEVFAMRDAMRVAKEMVDYNKRLRGIERQYAVGDIDEETREDMISELERDLAEASEPLYEKNRENDYSGLTALYKESGDETVAELEAKAQEYVDNFEDKVGDILIGKLWDRINACSEATLSKQLESGLMSQVNYDLVSKMFEYYVPLRGFDETTSDEVYDYLQHSQSPMNEPIKAANGRKSLADDPIATIGNMAESGIMAGNRNLMKQKFLNFAENHRSNILGVSDIYLKRTDTPSGDKWEVIAPEYKPDMSEAEMEMVRSNFISWFEDERRDNPEDYKYGRDAKDIPYKTLKKFEAEHLVFVKRGGKPYMVTVQGNPRAAQAVNGLTNPHGTKNKIIQRFEAINRYLASMFTNRNPAFVLANLSRDAIYANSLVEVKEGRKYAKRFHVNWMRAVGSGAKLIRKYKEGKLDMSKPLEKAFYDFIMNGGETGFTSLNSVDEYRGMIESELKIRKSRKLSPKRALAFVDKALDTFNRWAEDSSRFAAFLTSREMGRSMSRSIYDAKEITVNFNKKGAGASVESDDNWINPTLSQTARELFIFFNAGVQGIANVAKAAKKNPGKFSAMGASYFGMGVIMPIVGMLLSSLMGGDDDDYWDIPEYVRRNNLCICLGKYTIKLPLPIELRMFYGLGELAVGQVGGYTDYRNKALAKKVAEQMSQVAPIDMMEGGGGLSAFVPSYAKPVFEIYTNKDWTGVPIERQNAYNENMPNWTKAYKGTSPILVGLSEAINEWTGGDDVTKGAVDIDPAWVEHLWKGYFGGLGTTASNFVKTLEMPFNKDVRQMRNVPVLERFLASSDSRAEQKRINSEYFENKKYMDEFARRLGQYKKIYETSLDDVKCAEYQKKYADLVSSDEYTKYIQWKELAKILEKLNDISKSTGGGEDAELDIYAVKKMMNEMIRE